MRLIFIVFFILISFEVKAYQNKFIALRVSEANIRTGPGVSFPVKWILIRKNLPLEVIDEYDNWYKVRDEEEQIGWVHKSLVGRGRFFIVINDKTYLHKNPKHNYALYKLEQNVRGRLKSCRGQWCEVKVGRIYGWVKKRDIWGVYADEEF